MEQKYALGITLGLLVLISIAFIFVIRRSTTAEEYPPVQQRAYRLRSRLFVAVAVLVVPVMLLTLADMPYARSLAMDGAVQVQAVGKQWHWSIEPAVVPLGQPVVFNVTSSDVNHGFGIYDADMRLVAQTQAMPGYVNKLVHTFEQPGTYKVLCLEFCGSAHHVMEAELTVLAANRE